MRIAQFTVALVLAGTCAAARAADAPLDGKALYAPCVVCHQPTAWGTPDGTIPGLAGQRRAYLEEVLRRFASRERRGPGMDVVAAHTAFRDPQRRARLASYLAELPPAPHPVRGPRAAHALGRSVYAHACATCHGHDGRGGRNPAVPRLACQHYPYLRQRLEQPDTMHLAAPSVDLRAFIEQLSPAERDAVASYAADLCASSRAGSKQPW